MQIILFFIKKKLNRLDYRMRFKKLEHNGIYLNTIALALILLIKLTFIGGCLFSFSFENVNT